MLEYVTLYITAVLARRSRRSRVLQTDLAIDGEGWLRSP